jgi:hypothetical protein
MEVAVPSGKGSERGATKAVEVSTLGSSPVRGATDMRRRRATPGRGRVILPGICGHPEKVPQT